MAKNIPDLASASSVLATSLFEVVNSAINEQATGDQLWDYIFSEIESSGAGAVVSDYTAGEAVTTPIAVYAAVADDKVYIADNDDFDTAKVVGFTRAAASAESAVGVQSAGVLNGFTGLTTNEVYFLGENGGLALEPALTINEVRTPLGIGVNATTLTILIGEPEYQRSWDALNIGDIIPSANSGMGRLQGLLGFGCPEVVQADFPALYAVVGDRFEAGRAEAGWATSQAAYFYPTPPANYFPRPAYPDFTFAYTDVNVDDTIDFTAHNLRTGTPVKYEEGTSAITGLTDGTVYYIIDSAVDEFELAATEALAIAGTAVNITAVGTGTGHKLVFSFNLEESAFEDHEHAMAWELAATGTGRAAIRVSDTSGTIDTIGVVDGTVSNETRPAQIALYYYIKAAHVGISGEPVSAEIYNTGWIANSDWSNAELSVAHGLGSNLSDLIVKMFISSDGTEANAFDVQHASRLYDIGSALTTQYGLNFFQTNINSIKVQTGVNGIAYVDDGTGNYTILNTQSWYYKVVVYKANVLASYTGSRNTIIDIADANDVTVNIPDAGSIDYPIRVGRKGSGAGKVLLSFESGENETGITELTGDGSVITIISDGTDWQLASALAGCGNLANTVRTGSFEFVFTDGNDLNIASTINTTGTKTIATLPINTTIMKCNIYHTGSFDDYTLITRKTSSGTQYMRHVFRGTGLSASSIGWDFDIHTDYENDLGNQFYVNSAPQQISNAGIVGFKVKL